MPHSIWLLIFVSAYFVGLYLVNRRAQRFRSVLAQSCPHKPESLVLADGATYVCYGCIQEQIHERGE